MKMGKRIKNLRQARGISQTLLAELVGLTPSAVSKIELDINDPSLEVLRRIAVVFCLKLKIEFE